MVSQIERLKRLHDPQSLHWTEGMLASISWSSPPGSRSPQIHLGIVTRLQMIRLISETRPFTVLPLRSENF